MEVGDSSPGGPQVRARKDIPRGARLGSFVGKWASEPFNPRYAWEVSSPKAIEILRYSVSSFRSYFLRLNKLITCSWTIVERRWDWNSKKPKFNGANGSNACACRYLVFYGNSVHRFTRESYPISSPCWRGYLSNRLKNDRSVYNERGRREREKVNTLEIQSLYLFFHVFSLALSHFLRISFLLMYPMEKCTNIVFYIVVFLSRR